MVIGTFLKDKRNDIECVLYGDDGQNAVVLSTGHLNKESCGLVKIPWEHLVPTGQMAPIGSIPSKWYPLKEVT